MCPLGRSLILCCVGLHINILHFITLFNTYMEQFLPLCFFFMIFELRFWHKIYEQRITKRILKTYVCSSKSKPMSIIRKFIFQTDEEDTCGSLTLDSDVRFCVWRAVTTYKDRVNIQEFRHLGQENPRRKNTLSLSFYDKWNNECM